jgi:hypothetical protein
MHNIYIHISIKHVWHAHLDDESLDHAPDCERLRIVCDAFELSNA